METPIRTISGRYHRATRNVYNVDTIVALDARCKPKAESDFLIDNSDTQGSGHGLVVRVLDSGL